ncbi:cbb3-type cytochrome c oxidase subunit II [Cerasicoccus fimbriatus]|uniref:cbb3-type cytochrome c oxidase subunit II n=1 Tax=Cerasicoccus fimbriatus TaxID=3014554 RepID=UPI0022B38BBE|nr:cbb3-type cytochrome c oxidase subunit II [Cerasicoccus sp. TK19100]
MKNLPLLFFGIFFMLAFSWSGLILSSVIQFGDLKPIALNEGETPMPIARVGVAQQGKEIYINQGCLYCHSQQVRRKGFGADWERGWGDRQTVPRDYILQERVLLGTSRTGPDLMTIGQRQPSADWHHLHLYNPQITSPGSIMPPFRYLYKTQKIGDAPSPNALNIPDTFADEQPPEGYEIVPTERAEQLVEYLLSLKLDYELPESRFAQ